MPLFLVTLPRIFVLSAIAPVRWQEMVGVQTGNPGDGVTATAIAKRCQLKPEPFAMLVTSNDDGK